jgi:hypothetical protein
LNIEAARLLSIHSFVSNFRWEDPRDAGELPPGWERVDDEVHGTFYVEWV